MSIVTSTDRTQWLAERRKGIGASDAPTIVGVRKEPSRFRLWLDKRGEVEADEPNEAMLMGLAAEASIAEMYTQRTGLAIDETQIHERHVDYSWALATIDAYDCTGAIVEFKLAGTWTTRTLPPDGDSSGLPEHWIIQAQHQMWVTGQLNVHFGVWCADPSFRMYRVERDEMLIAEMVRLEEAFWQHVVDGTPPAEFEAEDLRAITQYFNREEPETLTLDAGNFIGAANDFKDASAEIKYAEGVRDQAKAELLMAMGNAAAATCGPFTLKRKVITTKERTQIVKASQYVRFTCTGESDE